MRIAMGFGRSPWWAVAVLVAVILLSLTGRRTLISQAAEDPPPVASSDSGASEDNAHEQETSEGAHVEEVDTEETSYDDSDEKHVDDEPGPEIKIDPDEVETEAETPVPPTGQEKSEAPIVPKKKKRVIGATATILEKQSGELFRARVDPGAKSCTFHCQEIVIDDEEEKWADNIGKVVHFNVKDKNNKSHWLEGRIAGYVIIKTSDARVRRYKVPLTLRWKGIKKKVLVTLSNRNGMKYPLLLGRNFLRGDFLVDVDIDNDD